MTLCKNVKESLCLYAITDRTWLCGRSLESQVEEALKGGATFLQLREKNLADDDILEEAKLLHCLCKKYKVPFVINDNVNIALKSNADGVHIGQSDTTCIEARKILGDEKIIGVSVQTLEQALSAEKDGADYLGVGAIFPTQTKDAEMVSIETLHTICNAVKIPVIAIGGINEKTAPLLKGTGIVGISVISAIFAAQNIENATRTLKDIAMKL